VLYPWGQKLTSRLHLVPRLRVRGAVPPLPTSPQYGVLEAKAVPLHAGERRYSAYSFSTSALNGGECLASRPECGVLLYILCVVYLTTLSQ
jgi:hypothetical protein